MIDIQKNISLKPFNTFGIEAKASLFAEVNSNDSLLYLLNIKETQSLPKLVLGGGSNVLFTQDFEGLVIKMGIKGIHIVKEDQNDVYIKVGAGENWHQFVLYCIKMGLGGVENLSLIPGTVGAAPMQNIGAYGVEVREVFDELEAIEIQTGNLRKFSNEDCQFDYRYSIFKDPEKAKDRYIITSVTFRLNKVHAYNVSYGDIQKTLKEMGITEPNLKAISDAVIKIRQSKLPDPVITGNAGSFFKNPTISKDVFLKLKSRYPDLPGYEQAQEGNVKVPAGWLIEYCGWKGKTIKNIGVHQNQALVLVNLGAGKGRELKELAFDIQYSVAETFGIKLMPEVNII